MPTLQGIYEGRTQHQRLSTGKNDTFDRDQSIRDDRYAFNLAMLDNAAYRRDRYGGFREMILRDTFGIEVNDSEVCAEENRIFGAYNPVRNIVDAYQNVFRGAYGQDIRLDERVDDRDVNPALADEKNSPVRKLWRWSNLDTEKQVLQEWGANLGTVGIRVVAQGEIEPAKRRVSLQLDHPRTIYWFREDNRGNVVEVELRYKEIDEDTDDKAVVDVVEIISKQRFVKEIDGRNVLEPDEQRNELGVCPYVILRHRKDERKFGRWAYAGSEEIIHWLNWIITNQGQSVYEHAWPQWFAAAAGPKPEEFQLGKRTLAYVRVDSATNGARQPDPIFEPLVPPVDHAGSHEFFVELMTRLQERQPEIAIGNVQALSGQSGETIAKLLIPAEAAILRARTNYEHALIRALQIGLSEGVRMALWDLGTGTGSAEAADKAYQQGLEDFAFAERPALPQSVFDVQQQAKADDARPMSKYALAKMAQGLGVDAETVLGIADFTPEEIGEILTRKRTADVVPTEPL